LYDSEVEDMPLPPEPDIDPDDDDWLFDSSRKYIEQLAVYKERRPKQNKECVSASAAATSPVDGED